MTPCAPRHLQELGELLLGQVSMGREGMGGVAREHHLAVWGDPRLSRDLHGQLLWPGDKRAHCCHSGLVQ